MNAPWQPNDKALCVRTQPWLLNDIEVTERAVPVWGQVYHVIDTSWQGGCVAIELVGFEAWWDAIEFIRIEPASAKVAREEAQRANDATRPTGFAYLDTLLDRYRKEVNNWPPGDGTVYGPNGYPLDLQP